ncbi:MAG: hypothetical protein AABM67_05510 [Acidobacteriota bacterium]
MELVGEQKRIQALFSELKFADEQTVPRFTTVWHRAEARTIRPARAFNLSFVAATALLVCALVSLALWSKYSQRTAPRNGFVATVSTEPATVPSSPVKEAAVISPPEQKPDRRPSLSRAGRLAAQRHALVLAENRKAAQDAAAISTWQSPTFALLKSQNDELLKSIPQLNENSDELKSFLPNKPK